jgi:hypothetical protein
MKCRKCNGTGRVTIDDTGLGWYLKEGRCPICNGLGVSGFDSGNEGAMSVSVGDIVLWSFLSAILWGVAGCFCALCIFKPIGSMVVTFAFGCALTGAGSGVLALLSFFGIYSMSGDMSISYGIHLGLMLILALVVGVVGSLFVLPHIDIPSGAEMRDAIVRTPICAIMAVIAMVSSLRVLGKLGSRI